MANKSGKIIIKRAVVILIAIMIVMIEPIIDGKGSIMLQGQKLSPNNYSYELVEIPNQKGKEYIYRRAWYGI